MGKADEGRERWMSPSMVPVSGRIYAVAIHVIKVQNAWRDFERPLSCNASE